MSWLNGSVSSEVKSELWHSGWRTWRWGFHLWSSGLVWLSTWIPFCPLHFFNSNYIFNVFHIVAILFFFTFFFRTVYCSSFIVFLNGTSSPHISISLLPIIRAINSLNKITAKVKRANGWSTWSSESCWCLQTLPLFDHHKKAVMKCASYLKVCHTQPDTEVVLLRCGRRDFFRPQGDRGPGGVRLHCPRPGQPGWGSACSGGPSTQMSAHSERTLESDGKKRKEEKKKKENQDLYGKSTLIWTPTVDFALMRNNFYLLICCCTKMYCCQSGRVFRREHWT